MRLRQFTCSLSTSSFTSYSCVISCYPSNLPLAHADRMPFPTVMLQLFVSNNQRFWTGSLLLSVTVLFCCSATGNCLQLIPLGSSFLGSTIHMKSGLVIQSLLRKFWSLCCTEGASMFTAFVDTPSHACLTHMGLHSQGWVWSLLSSVVPGYECSLFLLIRNFIWG